MSETLCTLRTKGGGGGRYKETSLWTNSAPTSNMAATTVTLSDSISNYKYIAVKFKQDTNQRTDIKTVVASVSDFKTSLNATANSGNFAIDWFTSNGTSCYTRRMCYVSDTSVYFSIGALINSAGTASNVCIPLEILGLNELDHGHRMNETVLWSNSDPTQTMSGGTTANLSDSLDNYDYVGVKYRFSTTNSSEGYTLMPVTYFKRCLNPSSGDIMFTISTQNASNNFFARRIIYGGSTAIGIASCLNANSAQTENTRCIPTAIIGCKLS